MEDEHLGATVAAPLRRLTEGHAALLPDGGTPRGILNLGRSRLASQIGHKVVALLLVRLILIFFFIV